MATFHMPDYLNGKVEILGQPRTVRLEGKYGGETFSAPMEVWIMALVSVLTPEQKALLFDRINKVQASVEQQRIKRARVVADIPMPDLF